MPSRRYSMVVLLARLWLPWPRSHRLARLGFGARCILDALLFLLLIGGKFGELARFFCKVRLCGYGPTRRHVSIGEVVVLDGDTCCLSCTSWCAAIGKDWTAGSIQSAKRGMICLSAG